MSELEAFNLMDMIDFLLYRNAVNDKEWKMLRESIDKIETLDNKSRENFSSQMKILKEFVMKNIRQSKN